MQVALRSRSSVATILVIGMLAAALVIVCSDGIHLPVPGSVSGTCATMAHTSALGAAVSTGGVRLTTSTVFATVAGFAALLSPARWASAPARVAASPGRPIDPLNGRLRL